jgi:signal transduction histidine kinase
VLRNHLESLRSTTDPEQVPTLAKKALNGSHRAYRPYQRLSAMECFVFKSGSGRRIVRDKTRRSGEKVVSDLNAIRSGRIRLEKAGAPTVFSLPDHVRQLINNLLSNALNYSPQNETVVFADCREIFRG